MSSSGHYPFVYGVPQGECVASAANNSSLSAVVLLASVLPGDVTLREFPMPVMTLSGELDGLLRITRVAVDYQ